MTKLLLLMVAFVSTLAIVLGERTLYHSQGHQGPYSYKFGYDTGPGQGYHRQFRHEEKDGDGVVYGKYGYFLHGKPVVVHYRAHPYHGFQVLKDGKY